jgi:amino acid transporter
MASWTGAPGAYTQLSPAGASASAAPPARAKALGAVGVCVVAFASIAGGPFGIEAAVGVAGALPTLLGLVATALVWSAPQALVTAELSCAFPSNAGYVAWVMRGLGPAAGFVNAWAMIAAQSLNIALYPVLIADYMAQLQPSLSDGALWGVKLACLLLAVALNVVGVQAVELASLVMVLIVQTPFAMMPAVAAAQGRPFAWGALRGQDLDLAGGEFSVFASTLCWNMQGWITLGSLAAEVRSVRTDYPRGLLVAVVLVALNYLWPVAVTLAIAPDTSEWGTGYFVTIAQGLAPWLGSYALFASALSSMSNLVPQVTTSARAMCAAARLGIVPAPLLARARVTRFRTPVFATLAVAAVSGVLMAFSFDVLVVVQLLFSGVGIVLQFGAFLRLKHAEPALARPYAVPFGVLGAWAVALPLFALLGVVVFSSAAETPGIAGAAAGVTLAMALAGCAWERWGGGEKALGMLDDEEEGDGEEGASVGGTFAGAGKPEDPEQRLLSGQQGGALSERG